MEREQNQCDGCQAGIPVDSKGFHNMSKGSSAHPDYMMCQKGRYITAETGKKFYKLCYLIGKSGQRAIDSRNVENMKEVFTDLHDLAYTLEICIKSLDPNF